MRTEPYCNTPVVVVGVLASFAAVFAAGYAIGGYLFDRLTRP